MAYFNYNQYCPYIKEDVGERITDSDILTQGKIPPKPHKWYTEDEQLNWQSCYHSKRKAVLWYGGVTAICLNCGAKTTGLSLAGHLTEEQKEEFDKNYSKDKFNNSEGNLDQSYYIDESGIGKYTNISPRPIVNKLNSNGKYHSESYIPDYCTKSTKWDKKHHWHTEQSTLKFYCESCGDWPMVSGYCTICGATSDTITLGPPLRGDKVTEFRESYSKEKFNDGEYDVGCWSYIIDGKRVN